ncbi:MAG: helix-turn-helix domain-containing protein [Oscillospiraceae bacterium]|nr:helix-turn-helix domain-containing protein [Oscillospiraceae bacterium]
MMELGKKIKQLRFKAGLTQEQLAEKLRIGAQSVSKWENAVAMPDITMLPLLAEVFGVSIDDLFDLTTEQRLNRIENRMVAEEELPADVSREFESFLQAELNDAKHQKRATELLAYFYWHRMNAEAQKASRYAKEAITRAPGEKCCQWILDETEHHAIWDWNIANHTKAVNFYRKLAEANPDTALPYTYLLNNLIADRRADEAERWLDRYCKLEKAHPVMKHVYRAYIALARFDEPTADGIMESLLAQEPENADVLFQTAQYYAAKADYKKAIDFYERAFAADPQRPRFQDALMGISDIYEIMGDYANAAKTYDRIIDLLEHEWGLTEETASSVTEAKKEKARILAME